MARRLTLRPRAIGVCLALALAPGQGIAAGSDAAPPSLSKPISAGSIALLVEHTARDDVRERLSQALGDGRPLVRAAAARVLHAAGQRSLNTQLVAALAVESDLDAASEIVRAIATLAGPENDEKAVDAARRIGPPLGSVVAQALGRARGAAALRHLPALRQLDMSSEDWRRFFLMAAEGGSGLDEAGAAVLREARSDGLEGGARGGA